MGNRHWDAGDHYKYIAVYVDNLLIVSKAPQGIINTLEGEPSKFKLKGTGEVKYHLVSDFFREEDGALRMGPRKHIERMATQHKRPFGSEPKRNVTSPLERNNNPELLDEDRMKKYQSLIGALQWCITLGDLTLPRRS